MIDPEPNDLFRSVTPHERRAGHDQDGLIESFTKDYVYVLFNGNMFSCPVRREDLDWCMPNPETKP